MLKMKKILISTLIICCVICAAFGLSINKVSAKEYSNANIIYARAHESNGNIFLHIALGSSTDSLNMDDRLSEGGSTYVEIKVLRNNEEVTLKLNKNYKDPYISEQAPFIMERKEVTYIIPAGTVIADLKILRSFGFVVTYDKDRPSDKAFETRLVLGDTFVENYDTFTVRDLFNDPKTPGQVDLIKTASFYTWRSMLLPFTEENTTKSFVFKFQQKVYKLSDSTQSYLRFKEYIGELPAGRQDSERWGVSVLTLWGGANPSVHDQSISSNVYAYANYGLKEGDFADIEIGCVALAENENDYIQYLKINGILVASTYKADFLGKDENLFRWNVDDRIVSEWIIRDYDYVENVETGNIVYTAGSLAEIKFDNNFPKFDVVPELHSKNIIFNTFNAKEKVTISFADSYKASEYGKLGFDLYIGAQPGEAGVGATFPEGATETISIYNMNDEKVYSFVVDVPEHGMNYRCQFSIDTSLIKDNDGNVQQFKLERGNYQSQLFFVNITFYKTINVNVNGAVQQVIYGDKAIKPEQNPTKESDDKFDYDFDKWVVNGEEFDWDTLITEDITIEATFTSSPRKYKLKFTDNVPEQRLEYGNKGTRPEDPVKEGYTFIDWYLGESVYDFDTPITQDTQLTGRWNIMNYTLTVKRVAGADEVYPFTVETRDEVLSQVTLSEENDEYVYAWDKKYTTLPASDVVLTEVGTKKVYTVSFSDGVASQEVEYGALATKPEDPTKASTSSFKYTFTEWQLDGAKFDFNTPITGNISLVAKFEASLLTCRVTFSDGVPAQDVNFGEKATKPADPTKASDDEYDYTFDGWYLGNSKWDFDTTITEDISLTAKFTATEKKKGCGSMVGTISLLTLVGAALVLAKKRR